MDLDRTAGRLAAHSFRPRQKNAAIPAIREIVNVKITTKMAVFCRLCAVSACFLCQGPLFHFREKTALES
jgi:hypothetical protein